jgi:hypothetical protein
MIYSLPDFISTYWYYLLGVAVVCGIFSYKSETFLGNLKKALIVLVVILLSVAGYELITGKSIINLPGSIDRKLSEAPTDPETGHRYMKSYEERYGEKPPDE